jgi:hypothetical protein
MKSQEFALDSLVQARLDRRRFFRQAGMLGFGAAAAGLMPPASFAEAESAAEREQERKQVKDTVKQIFTAALIAEDLATAFYYNGLIGEVIEDPNLAGEGGSATHVTPAGNFGNVAYIRAALTEEIAHANLLRSLLGIADAGHDPVQTFYFPAGSFDTLAAFTGLLDALENAFIGAYLNAIQELAAKAAYVRAHAGEERHHDDSDSKYSAEQLEYFAKVAASIMGIECEHRVLGRVISNSNPANNLNYEQTDGLNAVYNGPKSAVAALTPFLTSSTGPAYAFAAAVAGQSAVSEPVGGNPPAF